MHRQVRGQISAELIIILAILLGVVALVAIRMRETASSASANIQNSSITVFTELNKTACIGQSCTDSIECCGGLSCIQNRCA